MLEYSLAYSSRPWKRVYWNRNRHSRLPVMSSTLNNLMLQCFLTSNTHTVSSFCILPYALIPINVLRTPCNVFQHSIACRITLIADQIER